MPLKITFTLSDKDLRHFQRHIKNARSVAREMGEKSIIRAAEGLLEEVASIQLPDFIAERLETLEVLVDMVQDERWELTGADRGRVLSALAYFSDSRDMIPDHIPGIGYLDDAILVELIARELRHDVEGYKDFCAAEGSLKKASPGRPEDQKRLEGRRERLQLRIRRRNQASRGQTSGKGPRVSLW
jgi:uncharacterized membrane protein YkvA (DUF1232 family)